MNIMNLENCGVFLEVEFCFLLFFVLCFFLVVKEVLVIVIKFKMKF